MRPAAEAGAWSNEVAALDARAANSSPADVQKRWAALDLAARLKVLRRARGLLAERALDLAAAISPALARNRADTLAAEVMPLLDACRFLERESERILAVRKLGARGRPLWLSGVRAEILREPVGHVLVIGPANFPLFLPGAQVLQALAAGNRVTWKPGQGGETVARLVAQALADAGLPAALVTVTGGSTDDAHAALARGADKVILTGSHATGTQVLRRLAETATPAVVELSGCDAVFVLPSADLEQTARALAFGLRLNGSAVCMAPRRVIADHATLDALIPFLHREIARIPAVQISPATYEHVGELTADAIAQGARLDGEVCQQQRPLLLRNVEPHMAIASADVFAPVLSLMEASDAEHALAIYGECPYALTASIFCSPNEKTGANALARKLNAGVVLINDIMAPTADPRLPFGGRGASGYGSTRGAEGLLEMTTPKVIIRRRGGSMRHLDHTTEGGAPVLSALIRASHLTSWRSRMRALVELARLGRKQ